ncbi:MAG: NfeD family protein [Kiritimatiellaeota bacterium]|nr:NfeD family protein [Kiritimatiellota bacterium]
MDMMMGSAVAWVILGLALMAAEIVTPGFVLMFFGLSAVTVGAAVAIVRPDAGALWPAILFAALGVAYLFALRRLFKRVFMGRTVNGKQAFDDFEGQVATVTQAIAPNAPGKVEFRGAAWTAASEEAIAAGVRVRILRKDSLTLFVSDKL